MGAFELNDFKGNNLGNNLSNNQINNINNNVNNNINNQESNCDNICRTIDTRSVREENIISLKIYDSCRQQD